MGNQQLGNCGAFLKPHQGFISLSVHQCIHLNSGIPWVLHLESPVGFALAYPELRVLGAL